MTKESNEWVQTFSGKAFYPLDPKPEQICIEDIGHGLAQLCRFSGQVRTFYSVAEHSTRASVVMENLKEVSELDGPSRRRHILAALLHDSAEAFIVDVPSPIKVHLKGYCEIERGIQTVIAKKFGLELADLEHPLVRRVDLVMLATEKRDLMGPEPQPWLPLPEPLAMTILPHGPWIAERNFMERFAELMS